MKICYICLFAHSPSSQQDGEENQEKTNKVELMGQEKKIFTKIEKKKRKINMANIYTYITVMHKQLLTMPQLMLS